MKLYWRQFEKRVRQSARREVRKSRALRQEKRRVPRSSWLLRVPLMVFPVFVAFGFGSLVLDVVKNSVEGTLALVSLACTAMTLLMTLAWRETLWGHQTAQLLYYYPMTSRDVFGESLRLVRRGSYKWLVVILLLHVQITGIWDVTDGIGLAMALIAVVHWLMMLGLAALLVAWLPGVPFGKWMLATITVGVWVYVAYRLKLDMAPMLATALLWVTPSGWLLRGMYDGVVRGDLLALGGVAASVVISCLLPSALRRSRILFERVHDGLGVDGEQAAEDASADPSAWQTDLETAMNLLPRSAVEGSEMPAALAETEKRIRSREFLMPAEAAAVDPGWLDRMIMRWLTPRERMLAGLMWGEIWPQFSRLWTKAWVVALVAAAVTVIQPGAIGMIGAGMAMFMALPLFAGSWSGFEAPAMLNKRVAFFVPCPVGLLELVRMIFKVNLVRVVVSMPLVLFLSAVTAWSLKINLLLGVAVGFKLGWAVVAFLPVVVVLRVSGVTSDTVAPGPSKLFWWGCLFALIILFFAAFFTMFAPYWFSVIPMILVIPLGWLLFWVYRTWYNRVGFDMVAPSK